MRRNWKNWKTGAQHCLQEIHDDQGEKSFRDNRNLDSDEDDDYDCETGDYPSLESFGSNVSEHSPASPESSLSPRPLGSPGGAGTPRSTDSPSVTGRFSAFFSQFFLKYWIFRKWARLISRVYANG